MIKKMMSVGVLLFTVVLFSGCSSEPALPVAAPLGDNAVLEKLAASWEKLSDNRLAVSPASLPGDGRKEFLERVFKDAGYDYSATLKQMASQEFDRNNKVYSDMAELLLLPHRNAQVPMDPAQYYSIEELQAVAALERALNKP
ncbi:MAG: hypothetical protein U1B30_08010 [Pseudomonadota bacterium]|nr:hypothetical protein [Pseudomonadota bacterium]